VFEVQDRRDDSVAYRRWPDESKAEAARRLSTMKSENRPQYDTLVQKARNAARQGSVLSGNGGENTAKAIQRMLREQDNL